MFAACWLTPLVILIIGTAIALIYFAINFADRKKITLITFIGIEAVLLAVFMTIGITNTKAYESKNGETNLTVITTRPRDGHDEHRYPGDTYDDQYIVFAADADDNVYKFIIPDTLGVKLEKGSNVTVYWNWFKSRFAGPSTYLQSVKYNDRSYNISSYGNKIDNQITICGTSTESIIPKEKSHEDNSILFG